MKTLILFLCLATAGLTAQEQLRFSYNENINMTFTTSHDGDLKMVYVTTPAGNTDTIPKYRIKVWTDSVLVPKASWDTDTVLVKGNKDCAHEWLTQFETQKYEGVTDSLRTILNPNNERVVQEMCTLCDRVRIKTETIIYVWKKKRNQ